MSSTIYGRMLARLELPVLQRHCSLVFEDELQAISVELREMAAAYARLQEVREAVATLENGRADVRRSASLMETVESTAQVQEELMERMRLVERAHHSRLTVVAVEGGERSASETFKTEEVVTEDRVVEDTMKTENENRTKRRRRDSTNDDEQQLKQEEHRPVCEQSERTSSVMNAKKAKTTQHEVAGMEATEALVSSSETESEWDGWDEEQLIVETSLKRDQTSGDDWIRSVRRATGLADKALIDEGVQSSEQVTLVVERLCGILDVVTVPDGGNASSLNNGNLIGLIALTIRLLKKNDQDPLMVSLTAAIPRSIENAIARDSKLKDLRKHSKALYRILHKMTGYDPTPPRPAQVKASQAKESDFDWLAWRERVAEVLRTSSHISADRQALSFTEVSGIAGNFCDTLLMLSPSSAISMDASTRDNFFSMVASATRVFQCPGVTKQFVPLLVKVRSAIDVVAKFHRRFKNLHHHSKKLLAIQRDILNPTTAPKKTRDSSRYKGDDENARYEKFLAAYDKAHSWDQDSMSLKAFDEVMRVLEGVMTANTKTWRVRGNRTVSACLTLMAQRALMIESTKQRNRKLEILAKWQKLMELPEI